MFDNIPEVFVTPHEFQLVSGTLARITASVSAPCSQSNLLGYISAAFKGKVTPVRGSFTWMDNTKKGITGYVYAPTPVMHVEGGKVGAGFRQTAANMYMDESDKALWQMKEGAGGKYLVRQGVDDLAAMIEQARSSPRGSAPRMSQVQQASVVASTGSNQQFVSFVSEGRRTSEMDYGVVLGAAEGKMINVLSHLTREVTMVPKINIVASFDIDMQLAPKVPKERVEVLKKELAAKAAVGNTHVQRASGDALAPSISQADYWRLVYAYSPEYVEEIIKTIDDMHTAA